MQTTKPKYSGIPAHIRCDGDGIPILQPLPLSKIEKDFTVMIYGIRRTGKSFFARWLIYNIRRWFPFVLVFTETKLNEFWDDYVNTDYIHDRFSDAVVGEYINLQKDELASLKDPNNKGKNIHKLCLFDDCIGDEQFHDSPNLKRLFVLGRHIKNFTICCSQTAKGIAPTMRTNTDLAVILKMFSKRHRQSIIEDYLDFMDPKLAVDLMQKYTDDRQAICVFNSAISNDPWENIFVAKASDPGPFVVGCREMWENSGRAGEIAE